MTHELYGSLGSMWTGGRVVTTTHYGEPAPITASYHHADGSWVVAEPYRILYLEDGIKFIFRFAHGGMPTTVTNVVIKLVGVETTIMTAASTTLVNGDTFEVSYLLPY